MRLLPLLALLLAACGMPGTATSLPPHMVRVEAFRFAMRVHEDGVELVRVGPVWPPPRRRRVLAAAELAVRALVPCAGPAVGDATVQYIRIDCGPFAPTLAILPSLVECGFDADSFAIGPTGEVYGLDCDLLVSRTGIFP